MSTEIELLCHAFESSLSNDRETRQNAETYIEDLSKSPTYVNQLLYIISTPETIKYKLPACVALKNNLKTDDIPEELKIKFIEEIYTVICKEESHERSTSKLLFKTISQLSIKTNLHTSNIMSLVTKQLQQRDNLFVIYCSANFLKAISSSFCSFINNDEACTQIFPIILKTCLDLLNSGYKDEMIYKTVNCALKIYTIKLLTCSENKSIMALNFDDWMTLISLLITNKIERKEAKNEWQFHKICFYALQNIFRKCHTEQNKEFGDYFKKKWANHFGTILFEMLKACAEKIINPPVYIQSLAIECLQRGIVFSNFYTQIIKANLPYLVENILMSLIKNVESHFEEAEDFSQLCVLQTEYYNNMFEPRDEALAFITELTNTRRAYTFPIFLEFIQKQFLLYEQTQPTNQTEKQQRNKHQEATMAMISGISKCMLKKVDCVQFLERYIVPMLNNDDIDLKLRAHFTIATFIPKIENSDFLVKCYTNMTQLLTHTQNSTFFILAQCMYEYIEHKCEELHTPVAQSIPLILDLIISSSEGEYELDFEDLFKSLVDYYQDEIKPFVDKISFALASLLRSISHSLKRENGEIYDSGVDDFTELLRITAFIDSARKLMAGYTGNQEILQKMNIIFPVFLEWPIALQMKIFDDIMSFVTAYTFHCQTIPIEIWSFLQLIKNVYEEFDESERLDCFNDICPFLKNLITKDEHTFIKMCNEQNSLVLFYFEEARKYSHSDSKFVTGLDMYITFLEATIKSKTLKELLPIVLTILSENEYYLKSKSIGPIIISLCVIYDIETTMNYLESHNYTHTFIENTYVDPKPFSKTQTLIRYYVVSFTLLYEYISTHTQNSLLQHPTLSNMFYDIVMNSTRLVIKSYTHKQQNLQKLDEKNENKEEEDDDESTYSDIEVDEDEDAPQRATHTYNMSDLKTLLDGVDDNNLDEIWTEDDDDDYEYEDDSEFDSEVSDKISDITNRFKKDELICYFPTSITVKTLTHIDIYEFWKNRLATFPKEMIQNLNKHLTPQQLSLFGQ